LSLTEGRFARPLLEDAAAPACTIDARGLGGRDISLRFRAVARGNRGLEILLRCRSEQPGETKWRLSANGFQVTEWQFGREQAMTVRGLVSSPILESDGLVSLRLAAVESDDRAGIANASQSVRIEVTGLCLLEPMAGDAQARNVSVALSRRTRALAALGATSNTSAMTAALPSPATPKAAVRSTLPAVKKKPKGPWKRLKRTLRNSVGVVEKAIGVRSVRK
jgi:hypothetical protein